MNVRILSINTQTKLNYSTHFVIFKLGISDNTYSGFFNQNHDKNIPLKSIIKEDIRKHGLNLYNI